MYAERKYLGSPYGLEDLLQLNERLNAKVLEQVSDSQELVTLSNFTFESDEYCVKKSLQERITEIASWHWVLSDLAKRLKEAMETLRYEHKALRVVVERLRAEINGVSTEGSRPGALCPLADCVEDAICQELEFLKDQKKMFETLIPELEDKIKKIEKIKDRIERDIQMKEEAIAVDENITKHDRKSASTNKEKKKVKKKYTTIPHWQNRCASLKKDGLQALSNAIVTRQQVRGTRIQLSVAAQAYASRVDAGLRRRLHANRTTAQELAWQIEEASRDYKALEEELTIADKRLIENLEKESLVEARLEDRTHRPPGEFTKDAVDRKMKEELVRLKRYTKELRSNVERIMSLQCKLSDTMASIDNCFEDVYHVIRLDEERIMSRTGSEDPSDGAPTTFVSSRGSTQSSSVQPGRPPTMLQESVIIARGRANTPLETIQEDEEHGQDNNEEVDEDDDYPFDDRF